MVAQIAATGRLSRREFFDKIKRNKPIRTDDARFVEVDQRRPTFCTAPTASTSPTSSARTRSARTARSSGVGRAMAGIRDIGVVDGRFFTDQEDRSRAFVAVIGDTVRTTLFPGRRVAARPDRPHRRHRVHRDRRAGAAGLAPSAATRTMRSTSRSRRSTACTARATASRCSAGPSRAAA